MISGSGLGGHVVSSDPDGSVSFIVQQLRFLPPICLIHHQSFLYVPSSPVSVSFCSRMPRTCLVYQFPVNQHVLYRSDNRRLSPPGVSVNDTEWQCACELRKDSSSFSFVCVCVCIGSTFRTLSTTPRGTRIYVNVLYVSCRRPVNKTTTIAIILQGVNCGCCLFDGRF